MHQSTWSSWNMCANANLTIEHDVRDRRPDLVEQRCVNSEVLFMQDRLDHHELRRVEQRLVQSSRLELCTLALRRVRARAVEGVYFPHRLVAQQVFQGVAAEAASRARDDNDLLACGARDEVLRARREVR